MDDSPPTPRKAKRPAAIAALYDMERRLMVPLPFILGAIGALVLITCVLIALVVRSVGGAGLPFAESFYHAGAESWPARGGDWEVRDGALCLVGETSGDAVKALPLRIDAGQPYQYAARVRGVDGGLRFNLQQPEDDARGHVARLAVQGNVRYVVFGYFDDAGRLIEQGRAPVGLVVPGNPDWITLGVWVESERYHVLAEGRVIAANVELQCRGGTPGLVASASATAFDNVSVEAWKPTTAPVLTGAGSPPALEASITRPSEIGALALDDRFDNADSQAAWLPFAGDWRFEGGALIQRKPDGFDNAASRQDTFEAFAVRVTFAHREGAGGGLLFNMPNRDRLAGAHLVRYFEKGDILAWGYFDAAGSFVGQGSAAVPVAGTGQHRLEVRSGPDTYTIYLDGVLIADDIALQSQHGYIGLTCSQSAVVFESVEVYALTESGRTETLDLRVTGAQWIGRGREIVQISDEPMDSIAGAPLQTSAFRVSVDVLLPVDAAQSAVSGGVVFHMTGQDNPSLGQAVRFRAGGGEIMWGFFDDTGAFKEQGSALLDLEPGVPHTLTLVVHGESYDLLADGMTVVSRLLAQQGSGYIGLVSFGGPVAFTDFRITLNDAASALQP